MVETYPHSTYLDGFPEVKSLAHVLFDCAFVLSKSTLHEHIACHVGKQGTLAMPNSMKATVWCFYFHQNETRVKVLSLPCCDCSLVIVIKLIYRRSATKVVCVVTLCSSLSIW